MSQHFSSKAAVLGFSLLSSAVLLSGCIPILMGGTAVTTATVMTDRRTTGTIVSDEVIEKRISYDISQAFGKKSYHINVTSYEGRALLSGEVTSMADRNAAEQIAASAMDVRGVINELAVMDPSSVSTRMSDSFIASKVRTAIIGNGKISLNQMKVAVERGIVYLMGVVTREEAQSAAQTAAKVSGVQKVVTCFSIVSKAEVEARMKDLKTHQQLQKEQAEEGGN